MSISAAKVAKCPFYEKNGNTKIKCTDEFDVRNSITLEFSFTSCMWEHKRRFCDKEFKKCPMYNLINEKYGDA